MLGTDNIAPVSVVVPCFRCGATVRRAIASVSQQSMIPAEVILIDDASGDDTLATLLDIKKAYPDWIKILELKINRGAATARNEGWAASSQPFIAFLDADDAWHPRKIEIQYAYMKSNPGVALCGHGHRLLGASDSLPNWEILESSADSISILMLLLSNRFVTPSVMIRRDMEYRFTENQRHMEDHMLWLKIGYGGGVAKLSADLAAIYKRGVGVAGLSAQLWLMERGELGNYKSLYRDGQIACWLWLGLSTYSLLKFVRRLLIYWSFSRWTR